jgi:uncharacterized membrane protein
MSNVVVVSFDNEHEASEMRQTLKGLQKQGLLDLEDAAVIIRDSNGQYKVDEETSEGVKLGVGAGALAGLFVAFIFPILGIAVGVAGGALVAHAMDLGIDKNFVKEVKASLQPGNSALLLVVKSANAAAVRGALGPYKGTLLESSLDSEAEEALRDALKQRV